MASVHVEPSSFITRQNKVDYGAIIRKVHARIMSQHVLWVDSIETCVPANLVDHFSVLCDKLHRTNFV